MNPTWFRRIAFWPTAPLERIWRDGVYAARTLRREPIFALAALVTLTLGCVTTITVFSVADAELWRPLPFPDPDQLVTVQATKPGTRVLYESVSGPDFMDWRAQSRLAEYSAIQAASRRVLQLDRAESVTVRAVSANLFQVLRRPPRFGRAFTSADEHGACAAILSDAGWHRLFAADGAVVGRSVPLDGTPCTIVGVTAGTRLEFASDPDLFVAIDTAAPEFRNRLSRTYGVYGRLQPGVAIGQAQAELQAIAARIAVAIPDDHTGHQVRLFDLQSHETGFNWRELYFFLGAAVLVMILSCLNVANLLLSRALRRRREFAIRGALGGGRAALVRQLIVEGAVLALPAAAAGTLAAMWLLRVFTSRIPASYLERGGHIELDARVAAFVVVLSGAITLLLALTPMIFARRLDLNMMLGHGARTSGLSPGHRRVRTMLMVGQVTATLVLLTAAGLFTLSFVRLAQTPLGFDPTDRISLRIVLPPSRYPDDTALREFSERLVEQARATPGVRDAAAGSSAPLDERGNPGVQVLVPERPRPLPGQQPTALIRTVTPAYFQTLGIPLVAGRDFTAADAAGAPRVAIVNELLVQRMFPGESALGRRLEVVPRGRTGWTSRPGIVVIVGVVANVKNFGFNEVEFNNLYLPFAQAPAPTVELLVSTQVPITSVANALRRSAGSVDPGLPVISLSAMTDRTNAALAGDRFNLTLIGFLAGAAVLLAGVGIYGSMACSIQERLREFGIRLALGATQGTIFSTAIRESARVGLAGTVLGAAMALVLARAIGSALYLVPNEHGGLLYGVKTTDPLPLAAACVVVIAVAALSGLGPARHATRVDPMVTLREE
jgi:putative ABC transport system permease protein